jgi:hypothetical protein
MKWSPIFVATFADVETVRMMTHCKGGLDWERGRSLARHAWQTRDRRRRIEKFLITIDDRRERHRQIEKFLARIEDREPPEITSHKFEVDGQVIEEPAPAPAPSAKTKRAKPRRPKVVPADSNDDRPEVA